MFSREEFKQIDKIGELEIFILNRLTKNVYINNSNGTVKLLNKKYSVDMDGNLIETTEMEEISQNEYYE